MKIILTRDTPGRHPYDKPGTYTVTGSVSYKDGRLVPFGPLTATVDA